MPDIIFVAPEVRLHQIENGPGCLQAADMLAYLAGFVRRFPYPELYASIPGGVDVWTDNRKDCPPELFNRQTGDKWGGRTWHFEARPRMALNDTYPVRDNWAHEWGHVAQLCTYGLRQDADPGAVNLLGVMASTCQFSRSDHEAFANAFGAYLLGDDSRRALWRWFPPVLALWRRQGSQVLRPSYRSDLPYGAYYWMNIGSGQEERFCEGQHQRREGDRWVAIA